MESKKTSEHWTASGNEAFAQRLAFDFIAQVEKRMAALSMSQSDLANQLQVSEGAVSKLLNNPQNLTLRTVAKYSRALGIKASIVAYNDSDPNNELGPISAEVFTTCWERAGRPRDHWDLTAEIPRAITFAVGAASGNKNASPQSSSRLAGDVQSDLVLKVIQRVPSGVPTPFPANTGISGQSTKYTHTRQPKRTVERHSKQFYTRRGRYA